MEESVLYLWYMSETRGVALGHKTRFPARSIPLMDLSEGMDLSNLFENDYVRENLGDFTVEEVSADSVTMKYRGESFTLKKGNIWTSDLHKTSVSYLPEYAGIEAELS